MQNLDRLLRHRKNDIIFQKYGCGVTIITSSTQNQFVYKILVNTNLPDKFGAPMIFGLEVRWEGIFALPHRIKCVGQTARVK